MKVEITIDRQKKLPDGAVPGSGEGATAAIGSKL